jgi:hypothetical protein
VAAAREEEAERARLQQDAAVLQRRLGQLEAALEQKAAAKQAFDRLISQTDASLTKLVESSQMLLAVTQRSAAEVATLSPMHRTGGGSSKSAAVPA